MVVSDIIAFFLCFLAAMLIRDRLIPLFIVSPPPFDFFPLVITYTTGLWWITIILVGVFAYEGLYTKRYSFWGEAWIIIKSLTLAIIVILAILTIGKASEQFSRIVLIMLWFIALFVFPLSRWLVKIMLYSLGIWKDKVLIIGAGEMGELVFKGIREKHFGYDVVGFLDDDTSKINTIIEGKKVFGKIKHFTKFVKMLGVDTIIIAISLPPHELTHLVSHIQRYVKHTLLIPDLQGISFLNAELFPLFYQEICLINLKNNLQSPTNQFIKRVFELIVSIIIFPFLLILMIIMGILIKQESKGSVIYTQPRVGRNGRSFRVYKFRTMYDDAEKRLKEILDANPEYRQQYEITCKIKNDPRVTKIGGFLRKTSLDELPQIFNVLKGDMSLVGPRPAFQEEINKYFKDFARYYLEVRPGITGLWQVSGRNKTSFDFRVRLDTWYIKNWSLWLDVIILAKTIKSVLMREGAY